jgi:hypothetical protein
MIIWIYITLSLWHICSVRFAGLNPVPIYSSRDEADVLNSNKKSRKETTDLATLNRWFNRLDVWGIRPILPVCCASEGSYYFGSHLGETSLRASD